MSGPILQKSLDEVISLYRVSQKDLNMFGRLWSFLSTWPIFKTKLSIIQSKANKDVKSLFGKITHLLDSWLE